MYIVSIDFWQYTSIYKVEEFILNDGKQITLNLEICYVGIS